MTGAWPAAGTRPQRTNDGAATPNGKAAYVVRASNFRIRKITVATNKAASAGIKIKKGSGSGGSLQQIVITPDGKTAYVSKDYDGALYPGARRSRRLPQKAVLLPPSRGGINGIQKTTRCRRP